MTTPPPSFDKLCEVYNDIHNLVSIDEKKSKIFYEIGRDHLTEFLSADNDSLKESCTINQIFEKLHPSFSIFHSIHSKVELAISHLNVEDLRSKVNQTEDDITTNIKPRIQALEESGEQIQLPEDTYSLMMVTDSLLVWILGIIVFLVQMYLAFEIFLDQFSQRYAHFPMNYQVKVELRVLIGQFVCIFLAMVNIKDIFTSTRVICLHHKNAQDCCTIECIKVWFANALKLISALAVLAITFIVILTSADLISLLTSFAGLTFIADIDDKVFEVAQLNGLGYWIKSSFSEFRRKSYDDTYHSILKDGVQPLIGFALVAGMATALTIVTMKQNNGDFFYYKYPNCLIPPSQIKNFQNNKVSSLCHLHFYFIFHSTYLRTCL